MAQQEMDPNKIAAYVVIMAAEKAIAPIIAAWEKFKTDRGKEMTETEVDATVDIGKLKPWKRFEKSILVLLEAYPGLVEILRDNNLRGKLLIYDTGGGILFTTQDIQSYLTSARVSYISGVIKEVESALGVLERAFIYGSYGDSIRALFDHVQRELDPDFGELVKLRFEDLNERINRAGIKEFIHLQIPVLEYDSRLKRIFREIALACVYWVKLGLKFIAKLPSDQLTLHRDKILRTVSAASSSISMLKGLCDKYNPDESYRFNEASLDLKKLENMISPITRGHILL